MERDKIPMCIICQDDLSVECINYCFRVEMYAEG